MLSSVLEFLPNLKSTYFASMNPPIETLLGDHTAATKKKRLSMTGLRQTAKMKLLPSVFSCLFSRLKYSCI